MRVACNGLGREAIRLATQRARPAPLVKLAVRVEVGPAAVAPGQEVAVRSVRRWLTILVLRSERRHRHPPWQTRALLSVWVYWEPQHRRFHRHGFDCENSKMRVSRNVLFFSFFFFFSLLFLDKQTVDGGGLKGVQVRWRSKRSAG